MGCNCKVEPYEQLAYGLELTLRIGQMSWGTASYNHKRTARENYVGASAVGWRRVSRHVAAVMDSGLLPDYILHVFLSRVEGSFRSSMVGDSSRIGIQRGAYHNFMVTISLFYVLKLRGADPCWKQFIHGKL